MSKVIGIVQLKGGAGRSTVATNLAAVLAKQNTVTLVDCDVPQGTSASWYSLREAEGRQGSLELQTAQRYQELLSVLDKAESDYIVLDAPPRIAEVTRAILMISDLLLIPLGASAAEVWATTDLLDTIEEAEAERPIQSRIVWNKFRAYTRSAQELSQGVKKELSIPALKTKLGMRVAYSEALARGLSADEWSDQNARAEVEALGREVQRLLR